MKWAWQFDAIELHSALARHPGLVDGVPDKAVADFAEDGGGKPNGGAGSLLVLLIGGNVEATNPLACPSNCPDPEVGSLATVVKADRIEDQIPVE